jgi:hypothetical protein
MSRGALAGRNFRFMRYHLRMRCMKSLFVSLFLAGGLAQAKSALDFKILKNQLDQSGIYSNKKFLEIKQCVERAAQVAGNESVGGIGLSTPVQQIEKITKCKLDPKAVSKDALGFTVWEFKDCDLTVKFKKDFPDSIFVRGNSKLLLKTKIGIGSQWPEAKKKYFKKLDLRETPRDGQLYSHPCEIPDICAFDYPTLSVRGDMYFQTVTQIELNRFSSLYCPNR